MHTESVFHSSMLQLKLFESWFLCGSLIFYFDIFVLIFSKLVLSFVLFATQLVAGVAGAAAALPARMAVTAAVLEADMLGTCADAAWLTCLVCA